MSSTPTRAHHSQRPGEEHGAGARARGPSSRRSSCPSGSPSSSGSPSRSYGGSSSRSCSGSPSASRSSSSNPSGSLSSSRSSKRPRQPEAPPEMENERRRASGRLSPPPVVTARPAEGAPPSLPVAHPRSRLPRVLSRRTVSPKRRRRWRTNDAAHLDDLRRRPTSAPARPGERPHLCPVARPRSRLPRVLSRRAVSPKRRRRWRTSDAAHLDDLHRRPSSPRARPGERPHLCPVAHPPTEPSPASRAQAPRHPEAPPEMENERHRASGRLPPPPVFSPRPAGGALPSLPRGPAPRSRVRAPTKNRRM